MRDKHVKERSGKGTAGLVSVVGLLLVWTIVWANLPSKETLQSAQAGAGATSPPTIPELDLTIPGSPIRLRDQSVGSGPAGSSDIVGGLSVPSDQRTRQIVEVKCQAEVQQGCPDSLTGVARQRCVIQRMKQFGPACQEFVQRQLVRWKEADGYKLACVEDVKRVCPGMLLSDGRTLSCLQGHEQELSEACYHSLPKGHLNLRN